VSGQLHAPAALPPGKETLVLIGQEAGWAPESVWMTWWSENSFLHQNSNSDLSVVQPVASHYTDWAILAQEWISHRKFRNLEEDELKVLQGVTWLELNLKNFVNWLRARLWSWWLHTIEESIVCKEQSGNKLKIHSYGMTEPYGNSFAVISLRNWVFSSETSITSSKPHSRRQHSL
jgi:hypothetical protein